MAFPNEIQAGRFNAILHKLLDMKEGAPSPSLAPDIFSMLALEVDRPEWKFLAGERLCVGAQTVSAGGAGTYGTLVLYNPSGSGVLAVLEACGNGTGSSYKSWIRVGTADPSGLGYGSSAYRGFADTRLGTAGTDKPTCKIWDLATASPYGNTISQWYAENQGREYRHPIVLGPGTGVAVVCANANVSWTAHFVWRERSLSPSETR